MKSLARAAVALTAALLLWECIARSGWVPPALFPPPTRVAMALVEMVHSGELARDIRASLWRAVAGFAWGALAGVGVGLVTGRLAVVDHYLTPLIQSLRPLPPVAIIPLIIVWFGITDTAKVFSIGFAVFFPVWVNAHAGAREVPRSLLWRAKTLGAGGFRLFRSVILPSALPYIVAGCRNGVAAAFVMVFVSELAGASSGLGYEISVSHLAYRLDKMIAALFVLGACGAAADLILAVMFWRAFPWLRYSAQR
jgi:ABC-type nitrate/sulfonate/bicarbonate transport system permease component